MNPILRTLFFKKKPYWGFTRKKKQNWGSTQMDANVGSTKKKKTPENPKLGFNPEMEKKL